MKPLFSFCCLLFALSLPLQAELPFSAGDRFTYDLHWSFIKVGKAELNFAESTLPTVDQPLILASFTVRTSGIADKLFKVRDKIETWIEPSTGRPLLYKKEQREGKTERDIEVVFDWESMTASYTKNGETYDPLPITLETRDPLSLIVAIAGTKFTKDKTHSLAATDGKRLVSIDILRKKDRKLKLEAGKFTAQHFEVATNELQGVFEKSPDASIELWLSQDTPALPLKMKSEVAVGSFYGILRSYSVKK
ncbi:MAG: DUF3108 domain-containing protein [Opitutales bacterium]|nr:DUF3108 domain-containing protein [Opitutales bacterium]MDP4643055.1 DUF3108 domain-containing protein [Opitutales bacterium]MDP4879309.1 DUF3108 domain-containing protein [Opitutales bacterium]MDP5080438.1 DUF3108 domain-containing protein [Opitutales bacterium]